MLGPQRRRSNWHADHDDPTLKTRKIVYRSFCAQAKESSAVDTSKFDLLDVDVALTSTYTTGPSGWRHLMSYGSPVSASLLTHTTSQVPTTLLLSPTPMKSS